MTPDDDAPSEALDLFLQSPAASWIVEPGGLVILAANRAAEALLGYGRGELDGVDALAIHAPARREALTDDGPPRATKHVARSGALVDVGVASRAVRFRGRDARLVTIEPWGERLRLEEEVAQYRGVLDAAFDALLVHQDGVVLFANDAFSRLSGFPIDAIVGRPVLDFVAPELQSIVSDRAMAGVEGTYEGAGYAKNGERIEVELCAKNVERDGRMARFLAIRDITQRKRDEAARRRTEARFRELIERLPATIAVHRDGVILYANRALADHLGVTPDALVGRDIFGLLHPEERERVHRRFEALHRDGGQTPLTEVRERHPDGSIRTVEVTTVPLEIDGEPALFTIGHDVSARKRLEERLLHADLMASVGRLAAGVAHEINNPLSYLTLHLDQLARDLELTADAASGDDSAARSATRLVREAQDGALRIANVVRNFKVFSRASMERAPVDVLAVLESAIAIAEPEIRKHGRVLRSYDGAPLRVHAIEPRLAQVLLNVLLNAAQAIPEGTRGEIHVVVRRAGERITITIDDNGVGIPDQHLPRVFDPLFTTKPPGIGTGLGLWITKGILDDLGGTIALERRASGGTRCRITIPSAAAADADKQASPSGPSRRCRVLVVDDEPLLLKALAAELSIDHDVSVELSAEAALARLRAEVYDVILCDLMMPRMSGMDLYAAIAAAHPGQERRVVFMTGGAFTAKSREFLASVRNPRLEKPFDLAELRGVIRELAEASRSAEGRGG